MYAAFFLSMFATKWPPVWRERGSESASLRAGVAGVVIGEEVQHGSSTTSPAQTTMVRSTKALRATEAPVAALCHCGGLVTCSMHVPASGAV